MIEMIRLSELNARIATDANAFATAKPFRHIVLEDCLRPNFKEVLLKTFPEPSWPNWNRGREEQHAFQPKKLTCDNMETIPAPLDRLIEELNSGPVLTWLEKLTGIENLIADPHLFGGGLHSTGPGGFLVPHIDFHFGQNQLLHRRLNLLIYLNEGWLPENRGALELWNQQKDTVEHEILPEYGRMVIFQTDADSMHGFSKAVEGRYRNSIAMYYYTVQSPPRYSGDTATHWRKKQTEGHRLGVRGRLARFSARVTAGIGWRLTLMSHRLESVAGREFPQG
jgi:Rps23 Pro-64 3,4-dihydroxylase Tpa1-like proline 4-hydroxylase